MLLIGGGVSSVDIAGEISRVANRVYQSTRGGIFDLPDIFLPKNAVRVAGIDSFETLEDLEEHTALDSLDPIPLQIFISDGTILSGVHRVIVCTGYNFSLPFLRQFHNDDIYPDEADEEVLVTDGTQIHNLHKDIFYIPDPTLAFIGIPFFTATFTLFEFQAIAVATVFAGKASLPSKKDMRTEYNERVHSKGHGKGFHSLKEKDVEHVNELLTWINKDLVALGELPIEGHTKQWHEAYADRVRQVKQRMQDGKRLTNE